MPLAFLASHLMVILVAVDSAPLVAVDSLVEARLVAVECLVVHLVAAVAATIR